jgi:hypothetical protein
MFFAGYLGDKITLRLAKRRNGVHIPEDSLVSLVFPTIVCAIGIAVYAVAANNPEKYTAWGIIMGKCFFSPWSAQELEKDVVDEMSFQEAGMPFADSMSFSFLNRLDPPAIRLRSLHHHHHALRRRSLPEQPGPGDRSCGRG